MVTGSEKVILVAPFAPVLQTIPFGANNELFPNAARPFKLGLDLSGGSHLVYQADLLSHWKQQAYGSLHKHWN